MFSVESLMFQGSEFKFGFGFGVQGRGLGFKVYVLGAARVCV